MNIVKTARFIFAFAIIALFVLAGCQGQPTEELPLRLRQIKESGKLVVGTAYTAPFEYLDPFTGELKGLDVDLANAIAVKLGASIVWREMAFADLIPALQNGEVDMVIAGMYITDARKELVDMSNGYVDTGLSFVTRSIDSFSTTQELAGKTVCVKTGSTGALYAQKLIEEGIALTIKEYADTAASLADLPTGICNAVFNDNINSLEYIKTHPDLKVTSEILQPAQLGIAVQKGDAELLRLIDATIQEMKSDGGLEELYNKWVLGN